MASSMVDDWGLLTEVQCRTIASMQNLNLTPSSPKHPPKSFVLPHFGSTEIKDDRKRKAEQLAPKSFVSPQAENIDFRDVRNRNIQHPVPKAFILPQVESIEVRNRKVQQSFPNSHTLPQVEHTELRNGSKEVEDYNDTDDDDDDNEPELTAADKSLMKKILRTHLLESSHEVEVERSRSILYSVKSFEQLQIHDDLLRGVYAMGFNAPSKIQETTLPTLLANPPVNMIAQSQNGTGKTAAFLLASLSRVTVDDHYPQVLILSPTYELAIQTGEVAKKMGQFLDNVSFRFAVKGERLTKGTTITEQILIGTPGKVFDWARRSRFFDLRKIRVFVLDEADVMISTQGHQDQCIRIHRLLSREVCQMVLFSATYTAEVMEFAELIIEDPIIIRLRREEETLENVKQYYMECKSLEKKYFALSNIYGVLSIGQAIIFCRTKRTAAWLGSKMTQDGHAVGYLSSDLDVNQRLAVLTRFREGKEKVLITTNVCARGIDVEQVTVVINFDLPVFLNGHADCETYLHRIGRSGRFGKFGVAVNMVVDDRDKDILREIEEHFGKKINEVDTDDVDELENLDK